MITVLYNYVCMIPFILQMKKKEAERMDDGRGRLKIAMVKYSLAPTQHELEIPRITITVSGANKKIYYTLTTKSSCLQGNTNFCQYNYHQYFQLAFMVTK